MKFSYVHFLFILWLQIYLSWHIKFILCIYTEIPNTTTFHNIITSCNIYVAFSSESQLVSKPIKLSSFKSDFSFMNKQHKCHQVVQQCIDKLITRNTWQKLPLGKLQNAWSLILKSSLWKVFLSQTQVARQQKVSEKERVKAAMMHFFHKYQYTGVA